MRFILVELPSDWGIRAWRATCATPSRTVDIFFFSETDATARAHVRARHPTATFTDEAAS
jgi:alpha-L-fucosidase